MKLFLCPKCEDVVRLRINEIRHCSCKQSSGMYNDKQNAVLEGMAIPIEIQNKSLSRAISLQENYSQPIRVNAFVLPIDEKYHITKQSKCTRCQQNKTNHLIPINHLENNEDFATPGSSQGYQVYKCKICGEYWGCRYQWDAGSGKDDKWMAFGKNPNNVRRHY